MLNIFCLWVGNKYSFEYVEKLHSMVKANLEMPFQFTCLTDKPHLHEREGIIFKQAPVAVCDSWCKLSIFVPKLQDGYKGTMMFLDLDIVITGKLDGLVKKAKMDKLNIINDWWREGNNSSVMIWEAGKWFKIYTKFKPSDIQRLRGDQDLINEIMDPREINNFGEIEIQSYKANKLQDEFNKNTKIVVFHGKPKPHECGGWVKKYWR